MLVGVFKEFIMKCNETIVMWWSLNHAYGLFLGVLTIATLNHAPTLKAIDRRK
jgi:hypothetical protein